MCFLQLKLTDANVWFAVKLNVFIKFVVWKENLLSDNSKLIKLKQLDY